jgi:L-alanine-DL-glutamate epimerase-like enolase superfamily enzyme
VKVTSVEIYTEKIKLIQPYQLSFCTLTHFKSHIVRVVSDHETVGLGECTALPGYGEETFEMISDVLGKAKIQMAGMGYESARRFVEGIHSRYPFAASVLGTALDFACNSISIPDSIRLPLVFTAAPDSTSTPIVVQVEQAYEKGFRTAKVKIGRNVQSDVLMAKALLQSAMDMTYRFDANQGYDLESAKNFMDHMSSLPFEKIEVFEQPLPKDDWEGVREICRYRPLPIMLDESIYGYADAKKAYDAGTKYIKLKLCKSKGILDLLQLAAEAKKLGLHVVLGNGVSTEIGNLAEAVVFHKAGNIFSGAFEGNGFAKLKSKLLEGVPREIDGEFCWERPADLKEVFELSGRP